MRFATLFFNPTLYKKHLQRYWPIAAVWGVIWLLALPVQLWNSAKYADHEGLMDQAASYADAIDAVASVGAVFAIITAVAVMFHLFKSASANFVGALPMTRECIFVTAFAAGYTLLAAPLVIVTFITLGVEASLGVVNGSIGLWLGGSLLCTFFWLCFSMLCCVITGNGVAGAAFYAIFNWVILVMTMLVQMVLQLFLFGFTKFGEGFEEAVRWLTPFSRLSSIVFGHSQNVDYWYVLWVYAGVGFLMLLAAVGLHHIRKNERATDLIAFKPLKLIFKICVAVCGGLSLGLVFASLVFSGRDVPPGLGLGICCAVAAAISYYIAEMLLRKTLRVFVKCWKGAVVSALGFVLVIAAVDMDWMGFTTRVPKAETVKSATAVFYGDVSGVASDGLTYTGEDVQEIIALHQYLIDHRDELDYDGPYAKVELTYDLGLTTLRREYSYWMDNGALEAATEKAILAGTPVFDVSRGKPMEMYVSWDMQTEYNTTECSEAERTAIWEAIQKDIAEGNYHATLRDEDVPRLEMSWREKRPDGSTTYYRHQNFYPSEGCTHTYPLVSELIAQKEGENAPSDPSSITIAPAQTSKVDG